MNRTDKPVDETVVAGTVVAAFLPRLEQPVITPVSLGHINTTFIVSDPERRRDRYVLQRINTAVFTDPQRLMENYVRVTEHLRAKVAAAGGDSDTDALRVVRTASGDAVVFAGDGSAWRFCTYIADSRSLSTTDRRTAAAAAGAAFGRFQDQLADLPGGPLHETIRRFHDLHFRNEQFGSAVAAAGFPTRQSAAQAEVRRVRERMPHYLEYFDRLAGLPQRTTHNDTKFNNVLCDIFTNRVICVVDLDTVMTGCVAFDFGDGVRSGIATRDEDDVEYAAVGCDIAAFAAYAAGYQSAAPFLTPPERAALWESGAYMTFIMAVRFLTDYLAGDRYYRVAHPEHNIVRARNQLALLADLEARSNDLRRIVTR